MSRLNSFVVGVLAVVTMGTGILVHRSLASAASPATGGPAVAVVSVKASDPDAEPSQQIKALATRIWAITEAVAKHHDKPCPREQLFVAGSKALYLAAKQDVPMDLVKRCAEMTNSAQLATLLDVPFRKADAPTQAKLEQALLEAVLASVPGKASLVDPPSKKELAVQEQISGNRYVGIGIALRLNKKDTKPVVTTTILHGTARKAGMKADDIIESVDGKDTRGVRLAEVVDWLRGEEGSSVTVVVRKTGAAESRTYTMVRDKVPFEHVFGLHRIAEEEFDFHAEPQAPIAYVRIGSFSSSTLHELRRFERKLHGAGFRALVLDLRNNPGGSLQHAALFCGGLLDGDLMWTTRQDRASVAQEFRADHESLFRDWPMVVLINGQMGSATALVAAALHDNGRATLVGEQANMDGYVKSVVDLPGQKQNLVLPTGRVDRPKAGAGWPLQPDTVVSLSSEQAKKVVQWAQEQEVTDRKFDAHVKPPADPQLAKATELLRAALAKTAVSNRP
jgi:carboxyl-terminal processing protease